MASVRELEAALADCERRLSELPPAHHFTPPAKGAVKRSVLQARIDYLRDELSTAAVHEAARAVERERHGVGNSPTTTSASRSDRRADPTGRPR